MLVTILAAIGGLAGVGSLYASWRGAWPRRLALPVGWLLLGLSCLLWLRAAGAEFGALYGPLWIALCAWLAVGLNYEARRRRGQPPRPAAAPVLPDSQGLLRHLALFILAVPLAGASAILLSVTLVRQLPWAPATALATGILLMPLLWGLASYWTCADSQPLRPALALAACGLLCAAYVYG